MHDAHDDGTFEVRERAIVPFASDVFAKTKETSTNHKDAVENGVLRLLPLGMTIVVKYDKIEVEKLNG